MDKNKRIIIVTSIIVFIIIVVFSIISINLIKKNKELKENDLYIVIKQKDLNGKENIIYKELFTSELKCEKTIDSIIRSGNSNKVVITNGTCYVTDTTCPTHSCESYIIKLDDGLFVSNTTISCLPNGLFISLESLTE